MNIRRIAFYIATCFLISFGSACIVAGGLLVINLNDPDALEILFALLSNRIAVFVVIMGATGLNVIALFIAYYFHPLTNKRSNQ